MHAPIILFAIFTRIFYHIFSNLSINIVNKLGFIEMLSTKNASKFVPDKSLLLWEKVAYAKII